jgi:hypothetical protein
MGQLDGFLQNQSGHTKVLTNQDLTRGIVIFAKKWCIF